MSAAIDPWSFDYPERLDVARGLLVAALDAIDGKRYGVSSTGNAEHVFDLRDTGESKTAPAGNRGLTSRSELSGKEAGPIMLDDQSDRKTEARGSRQDESARVPAFEADHYARTLDELRRVLFCMKGEVTLTRDDLLAILLLSEDSDAVVWWLVDRCAAVA